MYKRQAEIHSMAMEFLTAPWHHLLFGRDTDKYALLHAEDSFVFLAYGLSLIHISRHLLRKPVCGLKAPLGLSCPAGTAVLSGSLLARKREHTLAEHIRAYGCRAEAADSIEAGVARAVELGGEGPVCALGTLYFSGEDVYKRQTLTGASFRM